MGIQSFTTHTSAPHNSSMRAALPHTSTLGRWWAVLSQTLAGTEPQQPHRQTPLRERLPVQPRTARPTVQAKPLTSVRSARLAHQRSGPALRVVHMIDSQHAPNSHGRMVISGRMADVCAELDRLAANETARECLAH